MVHLHQAYHAYHIGQFDEAERLCLQVLAAWPRQPQASFLLSEILLQRKRVAEAEEVTASALADHPDHPDLLAIRGEALAQLGRQDEALCCLSEAIERRLINPRAHASLSALLAQRRDPTPRFTVSVITPSIGSGHLAQAIASVQAQTYPLLEHLVVADGPECHAGVRECLPRAPRHPVHVLALPFNIGGGGFCGHRVYGAAGYLVQGRFVAFLDEDNWFEAEHVASLMARITAEGLAWAYALRRIVDPQGNLLTTDDCESLGQWPTWNNPNVHLVDANCYLLRRDLAIAVSPLWYRRFRDEENPDFVICRHLLLAQPRCGTNGRFTVNYRVGSSANSVQAEFFLQGNAVMRQRFGEALPWREPGQVPLAR